MILNVDLRTVHAEPRATLRIKSSGEDETRRYGRIGGRIVHTDLTASQQRGQKTLAGRLRSQSCNFLRREEATDEYRRKEGMSEGGRWGVREWGRKGEQANTDLSSPPPPLPTSPLPPSSIALGERIPVDAGASSGWGGLTLWI